MSTLFKFNTIHINPICFALFKVRSYGSVRDTAACRVSGNVLYRAGLCLDTWFHRCRIKVYVDISRVRPFPLTLCWAQTENKKRVSTPTEKQRTSCKTWSTTLSTSPGLIAAAAKQLQTIRLGCQAEPGQMMTKRERHRQKRERGRARGQWELCTPLVSHSSLHKDYSK